MPSFFQHFLIHSLVIFFLWPEPECFVRFNKQGEKKKIFIPTYGFLRLQIHNTIICQLQYILLDDRSHGNSEKVPRHNRQHELNLFFFFLCHLEEFLLTESLRWPSNLQKVLQLESLSTASNFLFYFFKCKHHTSEVHQSLSDLSPGSSRWISGGCYFSPTF